MDVWLSYGVVLEGQPMEGLLDVVCTGILGYPKKFVVVVHALQVRKASPLLIWLACAVVVQLLPARTVEGLTHSSALVDSGKSSR